MADTHEVDTFRAVWNNEDERTIRVLEALPSGQYDFRPDPNGRSIGELAWHLSEVDACVSFGVETGRFLYQDDPPNLKRPRDIRLLAPGYRHIHEEAHARLQNLQPADLDRTVTFFDSRQLTLREVLWDELLHHLIHHRAQLVLLARMAGGAPPGMYGPNREAMQAILGKIKK